MMSVSLFTLIVSSPPGEQPHIFHPIGTFPIFTFWGCFSEAGVPPFVANRNVAYVTFTALVPCGTELCSSEASWYYGGFFLCRDLPEESQPIPPSSKHHQKPYIKAPTRIVLGSLGLRI